MYKIIYCCEDMEGGPSILDLGLEMMDESFNTLEEAKKFIETEELRKSTNEWADTFSDEDDGVETDIEDYGNCGYIITNYYDGDPNWQTRYKIVEVK